MKFVADNFVMLDILREMRVLLVMSKTGADSAVFEDIEDSDDIFEGKSFLRKKRNFNVRRRRERNQKKRNF